MSNKNLSQLDTFNTWLGDIYGDNTDLTTLLNSAGFSEAEIEHIEKYHLSDIIQTLLYLNIRRCNTPREKGRNMLMVQCYGLADGKPQNRYAIGREIGVCGERVRQLVTQQLNIHQSAERQAEVQHIVTTIGRQLLDKNQQ